MDKWKYLKKHDNGHVDWSLEGFQMLNELPHIVEGGGEWSSWVCAYESWV